MMKPEQALAYALEKYAAQVEVVPIEKVALDSARRNEKRPAYVTLAVPDEVVKGLRGGGSEHDLVLLVRIPHDVLVRADSPIVLPGEVR